MVDRLMPDIESYGEFEQRVLATFEEISPVPFRDFHQLMQDYARVIVNLRDGLSNAHRQAGDFNNRLYGLLKAIDLASDHYHLVHPLTSELHKGELDVALSEQYGITLAGMVRDTFGDERYVPFTIVSFNLQRSEEFAKDSGSGRFVGVTPFKFGKDLFGDAILNQIVQYRLDFDDLTYKLEFDTGHLEIHRGSGIRIPRRNYQRLGTEVTGKRNFQDIIVFPKGNLIKQAHISNPYRTDYSHPFSLFGVDINITHILQ